MGIREDSERAVRLVRSQVRWMARAKPDDYLVAMCAASGSLPVVGRHLEPLGGLGTLGVWATRYLPDMVSGRDLFSPAAVAQRARDRAATSELMGAGLTGIVAAEALAEPWPQHEAGAPWRNAVRHRRSVFKASVAYGDEPGQLLDVWRRKDLTGPAPVLLFVPGGAWVFGSRVLQGHALMAHLAELGWVCVSMQYRTSPRYRWPRQMIDVKTAIAWTRAHIADYGGDAGFVAVAGCSAGGHMAALAGLTAGTDEWRDGLPAGADTSVDAVIGIYGRYDWEDRSTPERARFMDFLERVVVKRRQSRRPEVFRDASPVARVHADAPPFLVIHGAADSIIPVPEARRFVEELKAVSTAPVGYVELPGAGHGFDLHDAARTGPAVRAIGLFLDHVHRTRIADRVDTAV
jgi:acetyl esterase/lipase